MSDFDLKIVRAKELISKVLLHYSRPVVMSSFGKDSMVLLYLLRSMGTKLPVLFHKEPFFPRKYAFANSVIETLELAVYDYPPYDVTIIKNNGNIELVNWYQVGKKLTYLPTGVVPPEEGKPFLCGYWDIYKKPTSQSFDFPWDLAFIGHKEVDRDPIFGHVPVRVDLKKNDGAPDYAFPLRHFTDEDIWEFHRRYDVPVNGLRYDRANGFKELADVTFNNDYHATCVRCIDRDGPDVVHCPILDAEISNVAKDLKYSTLELPSYIGEEKR